MKLSNKIYFLIGIAIIFILSNAIFLLNILEVNQKYVTTVSRSFEVIRTSTELYSIVKDGETGQRGYILTDDSAYLKPYLEAKEMFRLNLAELKAFTGTTNYTDASIKRLSYLITSKFEELDETIALYKGNKKSEALAVIRSDRGHRLMLEISEQLEEVIDDEKKRLKDHEAAVSRYTRKTKIYAIVSNVVLLLITLSTLINTRNNRFKIKGLFAEVEKKNRQLEEQQTELQRISHDLIKQNRELERFAYVASHDLRAPAANIEALLRLYHEAKTQMERESLIDTIADVSENLSSKLNDLIEILRSKHDTQQLNEKLHFGDIYDKVIQNLSADIRQSSAHIRADFSEAPEITAPRSYLESILQNLISNAIKYRDPSREPEINIKTHKDQGKTCIVISDNGLGIDLEKHGAQLFGLYKTFHGNQNSKGVGLYITRAQVLSLGGKIDVDSMPGKGSTFTVCI